jgi:hypothetical protein
MHMGFNATIALTTITQSTLIRWKVKTVDTEGTAEIVQTIDRIKFRMSMHPPLPSFEVDTTTARDGSGTPPTVSKLLRTAAGSQITMKMNARGEFRDVKAPKAVVDALKDADPDGWMFGDPESFQNPSERAMVNFPAAAISTGGSWTGFRSAPFEFGTILMDSTYTRKAPTGLVENFNVDGKVDVEPKAGSTFEIRLKSQEQNGRYVFDNSNGVLKSSDLVQKMSMVATIGGHSVPTRYEWMVTMELKGAAGNE